MQSTLVLSIWKSIAQEENWSAFRQFVLFPELGRGRVLPYMGYKGMSGPKGYGFSAVFAINRVSFLADYCYFGHK